MTFSVSRHFLSPKIWALLTKMEFSTATGVSTQNPRSWPAVGFVGFGRLTIVVQRTSVKSEVVSTFPSFRFPELRQPI
jgi:hypothetical protein